MKGGRTASITPASPHATPSQRRVETFSFRKKAAAATLSRGAAKFTAVVSASGRKTSADEKNKVQPVSVRLRAACSPGARERQGICPRQVSQKNSHTDSVEKKNRYHANCATAKCPVSSLNTVSMQTKSTNAISCRPMPKSAELVRITIHHRPQTAARELPCGQAIAATLAYCCPGSLFLWPFAAQTPMWQRNKPQGPPFLTPVRSRGPGVCYGGPFTA